MPHMQVVITIPAYNEEKTLPFVLEEIMQVMQNTNYQFKILVFNDGSTDRTIEVAEEKGVLVKSNPSNLGLAKTFQNEIRECLELEADIIVHTDADGQYPAKYIPEMISKIEEGYDLVLGSRFLKNSYSGDFAKKIGNKLFARVISSLVKEKISDSTTGFRAFTQKIAKEIKYINTFTYTQEQIIKAAKEGFRIVEIPITTKKTRSSRLFRNPLQYAIKAWINIFRIYRDYNPLRFFGSIGFSLLLIGLILGIYFIYLHFSSGIQGHLGLLFLLVILLSTSIQIILFGFLADMVKQ